MVWYTGPKGGSIQVDIIAARVFHSFQSPITVIFQKFGFFRTNFSNIYYLYLFVFPGMSPFRLLYNLEVLLAHLMPIGQVDAAQQFSYDFLRNVWGGFFKKASNSLICNPFIRFLSVFIFSGFFIFTLNITTCKSLCSDHWRLHKYPFFLFILSL